MRRYAPWIWLAVALAVVGAFSALSAKPPSYPALAARSASPNGALAARLWLERTGHTVSIDQSLSLPAVPGSGVLLLLTPQPELTANQVGSILRWVRRGGHLVLATEGDSASRLATQLGAHVVPALPDSVAVVQPLLLAPPASRLAGTAAAVDLAGGGAAGVAATSQGSIVMYRPLGRGAVWLLTARDLLDNAHLGRAQNRRLLLNLIGAGTQVTFEEYVTGSTPAGDWLTGSVWGVAVLFSLAAIILYRWLSGWKLGPPLPAPEDRPRAAVEYVLSLAGLLQRAHRRAEVLRVYQTQLQRAITDRYGGLQYLAAERQAEAEQLLQPPGRISETELRNRVEAVLQFEERIRRERV